MSTATQTIALTEKLVKAKIPKATATELLDYLDNKQQGELATKEDIGLLWKVTLAGFAALLTGLLTTMLYLHSDLKSDINSKMESMDRKLDKIAQQKR